MKIAFYKAYKGDWQDWCIGLLTFSKYSHCEIVFSTNEETKLSLCASASARDKGVRFKEINLNSGKWDIYPISNTEVTNQAATKWFEKHDGDLYDWPGAVGAWLHKDWTSKNKKFCSEACAMVLNIDPIVTPKMLYQKLKSKKII